MKYNFFTEEEFNKLTPSCSLSDMDEGFMRRLDSARQVSGLPFCLSCAFRPVEWELKKGRSGKSWHTKGKAVDIKCSDSEKRFKIVDALMLSGIRGIIVYPTFIHADLRDTRKVLLIGG